MGKLFILETGDVITDIFDKSGEAKSEWLISPHPFNAGCVIIPFNAGCVIIPFADVYADSRAYMSSENKLFVYKIMEALKENVNIILIATDRGRLDKRLRKEAITLGIKGGNEQEMVLD